MRVGYGAGKLREWSGEFREARDIVPDVRTCPNFLRKPNTHPSPFAPKISKNRRAEFLRKTHKGQQILETINLIFGTLIIYSNSLVKVKWYLKLMRNFFRCTLLSLRMPFFSDIRGTELIFDYFKMEA